MIKTQLTKRFQESGWAGSITNTWERGREQRANQKVLGFPPNTSAVPHDPGSTQNLLNIKRSGKRVEPGCVCEAQAAERWAHPILLPHLTLNDCFVLFKPNLHYRLIFLRYTFLLQRGYRKKQKCREQTIHQVLVNRGFLESKPCAILKGIWPGSSKN